LATSPYPSPDIYVSAYPWHEGELSFMTEYVIVYFFGYFTILEAEDFQRRVVGAGMIMVGMVGLFYVTI
jgi:hypothetical protein